jgi:hypothetical protein
VFHKIGAILASLAVVFGVSTAIAPQASAFSGTFCEPVNVAGQITRVCMLSYQNISGGGWQVDTYVDNTSATRTAWANATVSPVSADVYGPYYYGAVGGGNTVPGDLMRANSNSAYLRIEVVRKRTNGTDCTAIVWLAPEAADLGSHQNCV